MEPLAFPPVNPGRVLAIAVAAFTVFAAIAAIALTTVDNASKTEVAIILALIAAGSIFLGLTPYFYEVAGTAIRRVSRFNATAEKVSALEAKVARATAYLRSLNTDLDIQEIRDEGGTVHLVFGYGTAAGLGDGSLIEVVRQAGGQSLGTVQVVRASEDWSLARPLNRAVPEFWEGLEDRMRSDFSPPAAVVGRVFRITGSTVVDVLYRLEPHDKQGATNGG